MSDTDHILEEIQEFESLVEKLRLISKDMSGVLRPKISEILEFEKDGCSIKSFVLDHGIPIVSSDELYFICSYEKPRDYILEKDNDDMIAIAVVLAVILSYDFYTSVGVPLTACLKTRRPDFVIFNAETCMAPEDIEIHLTGQLSNISKSLRNTFEKLKQSKDLLSLIQTHGSLQGQFEELSSQDYIIFNDFVDSVLDDDYDLFKKTANIIANEIGMHEFLEGCEMFIKMSPLSQAFNFMGEEDNDSENVILDKYLSMNGISINDISRTSPVFCRSMINYNSSTITMIENLPDKAKEAIESFWEELGISWLAEPFKKWIRDEFEIIKKSVLKENKKRKTRRQTKKDHLNVSCRPKMVKKLAEGLVKGHENPYLPKLVSSKAGNEDAINKLVYLFTGETDNEAKLPYNLVWNKNYCLNGLRLLIYLLHFSGEFKDNDPLNALDDNDETSKDGISEVIKFKNTGRKRIFPIVEKAFNTGTKSIQNAKSGNREFLEQIVLFWWYCKNSDKAATE